MTNHDPLPLWRRMSGTLLALLAVVGVLVVIVGVVVGVAAKRMSALLEPESPAAATPPVPTAAGSDVAASGRIGQESGTSEAGRDREEGANGEEGPIVLAPLVIPLGLAPPEEGAPVNPPAAVAVLPVRPVELESEVLTLDSEKDVTLPAIAGKKVTLKGRAKKLVVKSVVGGGRLDATELEADSIQLGPIDGGSTVRVKADKSVSFLNGVVGKSVVEVRVPEGRVGFAGPVAVDGGSRVTLVAEKVEIRGVVGGMGTDVAITFVGKGSLKFETLDGSARLRYGKSRKDDDDPKISRGDIRGEAKFGRFDE